MQAVIEGVCGRAALWWSRRACLGYDRVRAEISVLGRKPGATRAGTTNKDGRP